MLKSSVFKRLFGTFALPLGLVILVSITILPVNASGSTKSHLSGTINFAPYPPMVYPVRIGIATRSASSNIYLWEPGAVFVDGKAVFPLAARHVYHISNGRISDLSNGSSFPLPTNQRAYIASERYRVWANNRWYGGVLEIISFGNRTTLVNLLDLEDYLCGVVPAEMPANWHLEALKAQAVAARSYAYAHTGAGSKWYRSEGYDLVPDTRDQVYKGQAVATNSTNIAVFSTRGIILKDAGRVKPGFYRAWVGNAFENLNIRSSHVNKAVLEKITGVPGIIGVTVKQWDQNANASSIQVIGKKKSREVNGIVLANWLHFSTAGILDIKEDGNSWLFTYRGPGNGSLGLSQHGANMLAANGWRFMQILQQYYQDPDGKLRLDYMDKYKRPPSFFMPASKSTAYKESDETQESEIEKQTQELKD